MAARLAMERIQPMRQSVHDLVAKAPWSDAVLLERVRDYVLPTMRKQGAVVAWIVDDTGAPGGQASRGGCQALHVRRETSLLRARRGEACSHQTILHQNVLFETQ